MKKKNLPQMDDAFDDSEFMNQKIRPSIKKSSFAPPGFDPEKDIYEAPSLEANISTFNVVSPGTGTGDTILQTHNPTLLAMSKRAKSTIKPKVKMGPNHQSATQGITSLLSKKPLSDLPEPSSNDYFEMNQRRSELEKIALSFDEDPIAYFSKRKDGRGHLFIYMKYSKKKSDPDFSPYELEKVPFSEAGKDYYTMSANGVTHIDETGNTETFTLDRWAKEESTYKSIRKLRTFRLYFLWKPLRVWRNFVQQMHFKEKLSTLIKEPLLYNNLLSKTSVEIAGLLFKSDKIITTNILTIVASRKYIMRDFEEISDSNIEILKTKYRKLIDSATEIVNRLYANISDPKLLVVEDSEFREIKRKNPNIQKLMVLEQKKDNERIFRTAKMETEVKSLIDFLRMLDYLLLENLRSSCYKSWKYADEQVSSDLSAVFTVEVSFSDNGEIVFTPSKEGMIELIDKTMNNATTTLESLPRLLKVPALRVILKEGIDVSDLFNNGPILHDILESHPTMKDAVSHIKEIISNAYVKAHQYSQSLISFFPLYKLGKTWDVRNYIKKRNGEKYVGTAHFSDERDPNETKDFFLTNSQNEPVIDFEACDRVIEQMKGEISKVEDVRLGVVRGPLYIDSKALKSNLTPIPSRSLKALETTLSDLISTKISLLNNAFQSFTAQMKQDPTSLDLFVDFSEIVQKTTSLLPQMTTEIHFIDEVIDLFERAKFSPLKNPLHSIFEKFKTEQKKATQVRTKLDDKFTFVLKQLIKKKELKLQHYKSMSQDIPLTTKDIDFEAFLKKTLKLKKKSENLETPISKMIHQQKVLNLNITDFPDYIELKHNILFSEKIYQVAKQWENLNSQISSVPFAHISMKEFGDSVDEITGILEMIKDLWKKPSPILSEVSIAFGEISPFVTQLCQLSNGRMQTRHWKQLYEECGYKGQYSLEITIQDMLVKGILSHSDIIEDITGTSQGESQLENEFNAISTHWADVTIPLLETPPNTDDQLLLGDLSSLLSDIRNTSETLNLMLSNRFVKGIRTQVFDLSQNMEQFMNILGQWQIFQGNWTTISSLFKQGAVRKILPHQATRFEVIRKKWKAIVEHTLSDNKIFSVCSYLTLLEDFIENNKSLDVILESIPTFLDNKRESIPRLFFLSNDEVLTLLSTTDFAVFTQQLVKIMMHITRLDSHTSDAPEGLPTDSAREGCNFVGLKIFGVVGEDGDSLPFVNAIQCSGPIDYWIPQIFEIMELSTKDALTISLSRFASSSMTEWVMTVSSYIAALTLHIAFARDVEDCFNNLEANPRSFLHFEQNLKHQIHDLMLMMSTPLSPSEQMKITSVLNLLLNHYEKAHSFQEKIPSFSYRTYWHDQLKFKYDANTAEVNVCYGDDIWMRGKEYWGMVPRLIFTPSVENAILNLCVCKSNDHAPLIFGPSMSGKTKLYETYNCLFGRFSYAFSSFPNIQPDFIEKILLGSAYSGCSLIFKNIGAFSHRNQSIIFDLSVKIRDSVLNGTDKFKIREIYGDLNNDVRIFFTASEKYSSEISPQLREYVRPIALSIPNIKKIIESRLIAYGFKSARIISQQLDDFTTVALTTFEMPPIKAKHLNTIIEDGHSILRQLMHNTKVEGVDYYTDPKLAEQFSISRSVYNHFKVLIPVEKLDLLFILLYGTFHLFDDINKFTEILMKPFNFFIDKASAICKSTITEAINNLGYEVPTDYILQQTQSLMEMLFSYPLIIIHGPPRSGKSLIVDLLSQAFNAMISDADLMNHYKGLMPFKVETIYHQSDSFQNIFGTIVHDDLMGNRWRYGSFHSAISYLEQFSKTHHRILRFDGVVTSELNNFLYQFSSNPEQFILNNLGTFRNDRYFHCIVETDDISHISPSMLNVCGLLVMNTVQSIRNDFFINIDLIHPSIPFSMIQFEFQEYILYNDEKEGCESCHKNKKNNCLRKSYMIKEEELATIRSIFCEMAPVFVKQFQIDFSLSAARFCLNYLIMNKIECSNEDILTLVMATSFYICYSSYSTDSLSDFSKWICKQFQLKLPNKWEETDAFDEEEEVLEDDEVDEYIKDLKGNIILTSRSKNITNIVSSRTNRNSIHNTNNTNSTTGNQTNRRQSNSEIKSSNRSSNSANSNSNLESRLPPDFVEYYEKPTLECIQVIKDKIMPIDASALYERIIVHGSQFADDFIVPNIQHLSAEFSFKVLMRPHSHILLNGPKNSGKNSLLKYMFSKEVERIHPVFFNTSSKKTVSQILHKIRSETTLMQKTVTHTQKPKIFALVFNNLTPDNTMTIEFIRQIITERRITITSSVNPNQYDIINLDNFFVVVNTSSLDLFDVRFLVHFTLVHVEEYLHDTKMYIVHKAMSALGISAEMISLLTYIFDKLNYSMTEMIDCFIIFANISVKITDTIRVLMTIIFFNRFNKTSFTENEEIANDSEEKFTSFIDDLIGNQKFLSFRDALMQFKTEKIFARSMQGVSSEVLILDPKKIKEFMSRQMKTTIYDESVFNFIQIDQSLGRLGHNCVVYSSTASSRMTLINLVCSFQGSNMSEVNDTNSIKEFITKLIEDDGFHVQILVVRLESLIDLICKFFIDFTFTVLYDDDEITSSIVRRLISNTTNKRQVLGSETASNAISPMNSTSNSTATSTSNSFIKPKNANTSNKNINYPINVKNENTEEALAIIDSAAKVKALNKFKKLLKWNVRIVIVPDSYVVDDSLIKPYVFDIIHLQEPSKHSICSDLIKESNSKQLELVLCSISEGVEPFLPFANVNQFYDFVSTFVHYMSGDMKNAQSKNEEVKKAIDFFSKLSLENTIFNEKLNTLQPTLGKLKIDSETSRDAFTSKNDAIAMRKLKLGEEKMFMSTELQNKEEELRQAEADTKQLVPNVEIALSHVKELNNSDIEPIRITESDPCESLKLMLEAIAVLIGVPNTSYESFGHSLLMDENFIKKIVNNVDHIKITSTTYENLLPYLSNDKMSKKELESVAPVLVTLRNYIEAVCSYAARNNLYKEKKIQVEMLKRSLNDYIADMERELDSISDIEALSTQEQRDLQQLQVKYEEIQKQYEIIEKQKLKIDSILEDDKKLTGIWSKAIEQFSGQGDTMIGDSILMAVYLTYAGMLDLDGRKELLDAAKGKLDESSLQTSFTEDIYSKITSKIIAESTGFPDDIVLPQSALIDFKHMQMTPRIPLLVDPDGIFVHMIRNEQTIVVSLNSTVFYSAVIDAVKEGNLLIITDVDEFDAKITKIITILKKPSVHPSDPNNNVDCHITIQDKVVEKNANFRVIFASSIADVDQIPPELLLRVTVINVSSSSIETIHTSIVHSFVNYFAPTLMPRIIELQKAELAHHVQVKQYELDILNIVSYISTKRNTDPKYDYLEDSGSIEKLLKSKASFFEALGTTESATDVKNELEEVTKPFQSMISIVQTFWICMARYLPKVKTHYRFNFDSLINIVKQVFLSSNLAEKELNDNNYRSLRSNLISSMLRWLYPMLDLNDSIFFLFLSAFMIKEGNWDDLSVIIQNLSAKVKKGKITSGMPFQFDYFEKLKTCDICDFFNLLNGYIGSYFGDNFSHEFPFFQIELTIPSSSSIPSIIISKCGCDPVHGILKYVKSKAKFDSFECISLTEDEMILDEIKHQIHSAMNRGNWVLLNYTKPSKKCAALINDVMYLTSANPVHQSFKLFVNCHTTDFISSELLSKSKIISYNNFPSIRQTMLDIYQNYAHIIHNSTNLKTLKRLFYIGAMAFAQIKSRAFIQPIGFNAYYGLSSLNFEDYIKYTNSFVERYSNNGENSNNNNNNSNSNNINNNNNGNMAQSNSYDSEYQMKMRNLREFVQNLAFGSRIIETQDRRRVRAILASFFSNATLEDSFTFVDQSIGNNSIWNTPADGTIAQFTSHIGNMPFFNKTDVLMMNYITSDPLMNWNLSRWVAEPFLAILNEAPQDDEHEDEDLNENGGEENQISGNEDENESKEKKKQWNYPEGIYDLENKAQITPLAQFWIIEIDFFNDQISSIVENSDIEKSWSEMFSTKEQFVSFLYQKRDFLINAYNQVTIDTVDLHHLNDIRGFFTSYRLEFCYLNNLSSEQTSIEFDWHKTANTVLQVNGLSIMNGFMSGGYLLPVNDNQSKVFAPFPPIYLSFGEKVSKQKYFVCPLFKTVFVSNDVTIVDGELENFIIDVSLNTQKGDRNWLLNSTALYVHVPPVFS